MTESNLADLLEVALPGGPSSLRHAQGGADALAAALYCELHRAGLAAPAGTQQWRLVLPCLGKPMLAMQLTTVYSWATGLMIGDGYVALDRSGKPLRGYTLPQEWNEVPHLWAFLFSRCACLPFSAAPAARFACRESLGSLWGRCCRVAAPTPPPACSARLPAADVWPPTRRCLAGPVRRGCSAWSAGSTQQLVA